MAASVGDQDGTVGSANVHDGQSGGSSGDWCIGLSCAGKREVGGGIEKVEVRCL